MWQSELCVFGALVFREISVTMKGAVLTDTEIKSFRLATKLVQHGKYRFLHPSPMRNRRLNSPTHSIHVPSELDFHMGGHELLSFNHEDGWSTWNLAKTVNAFHTVPQRVITWKWFGTTASPDWIWTDDPPSTLYSQYHPSYKFGVEIWHFQRYF